MGKLQWIQNDVDSCADAAKRSDYKSKLKREMRRSDRNSMSTFNFRGIIAYCLFDDIFEKHNVGRPQDDSTCNNNLAGIRSIFVRLCNWTCLVGVLYELQQ